MPLKAFNFVKQNLNENYIQMCLYRSISQAQKHISCDNFSNKHGNAAKSIYQTEIVANENGNTFR